MDNLEERHKIKFLRILEKELDKIENPSILEFGVSIKNYQHQYF